ncbi:DgyrCDS5556 [Dimorphilus gyrociliatus]|uniref:DgyrCDS5556 n=1 Tax=Dimorphilus gyrociliatus TaxID=2664684 RepID=A0A7I8VKA8_9ANNE|nr:DgyrCDS5556 [Dimorphilus gyrociliatus]
MNRKICVVGAGAVGLSTALKIQTECPNAKVTVLAKEFYDKTTSFAAAGIYLPGEDEFINDPAIFKKWLQDSWDHYSKLCNSKDAGKAGAQKISGYFLFKEGYKYKRPIFADIVYQFRELSNEELKTISYGYFITTVVLDPSIYLKYLEASLRKNGTELIKAQVNSLEELSNDFDIIVNCSGLGSQKLANDSDLYPVKGQVLKVEAPWMKHFTYVYSYDATCYVIPGVKAVTVGGTREKGNYDKRPDSKKTEEIWERALGYFPELYEAKRNYVIGGLRPTKLDMLVKPEILNCGNGKSIPVIHNYGHGKHGIALSWGTATESAKLAKSLISNSNL